MHVTSLSGVNVVTPTEWQHWFSVRMLKKTHKTHLKQEKALRLTEQIDLPRNLKYILTDCQKLQKK